MRDAVSLGYPPVSTCSQDKDALLQLDVSFPFLYKQTAFGKVSRDECFWPQLSILPQLYADVPNSTFLLMFRPVEDWIRSAFNYKGFLTRLRACNLPNLLRNFPPDLDNTEQVNEMLTEFWCSHVLHVRQFIKDHPSVTLLEMDLYDPNRTSYVLSSMFPSRVNKQPKESCWGHANRNNKMVDAKK